METKLYEIPDDSRKELIIGTHLDEKVSIGKNSHITLICRLTKEQTSGPRSLTLMVGKKSTVRFFVIQSSPHVLVQKNHIGPHARIDTFGVWTTRGAYTQHLILEGEGSQGYDVQLFSLDQKDIFKLHTTLEHEGVNTKGNLLAKGIVHDQSYATLHGMIKVDKTGAGAASYLQQNVLILDPTARADANPELEIENNDVSSRHGATIGPIDEEKIFYLMTRGSTRHEARALIIEGFLKSAIEHVEDEKIRHEILFTVYGDAYV